MSTFEKHAGRAHAVRAAQKAAQAAQAGAAGSGFRCELVEGTRAAAVYLYDEIGFWGVTANDFANQVATLDVDRIDLYVNSPGGDVFDGIAILNILRRHKAKVHVTVDGLAASAASFIIMAGDEIVMAENSELMIHDAWGMCMGNAHDMTVMAGDLDRVSTNIASIYAGRAGGDAQVWRAAMLAETWYSADEAVEAGLADRVDAAATDAGADKVDAAVAAELGYRFAGRADENAPAPYMPNHDADADAAPVGVDDAVAEVTETVKTVADEDLVTRVTAALTLAGLQ